MIVIYRLCNIPSTNPSPVYQEDKKRLNELCLRSFVSAFKSVEPTVVFLADFCGREYEDIIKNICPFPYELVFTDLGINGTALKSYDVAKDTKDDVILFQECDYVYRPSVGSKMVEAIKHFGLLSPYDHPDFYTRDDIHNMTPKLEVFQNEHFRSATRNTMTFGMTREAFKKQYDILYKYGYLDNEVWHEMRENGNELWTPLPAYATHMTRDFLSPAIPWEVLFKLYE